MTAESDDRLPTGTQSAPADLDDAIAHMTTKKLLLNILPFLIVCYIEAFLDRVNLGFAAPVARPCDDAVHPGVAGLDADRSSRVDRANRLDERRPGFLGLAVDVPRGLAVIVGITAFFKLDDGPATGAILTGGQQGWLVRNLEPERR